MKLTRRPIPCHVRRWLRVACACAVVNAALPLAASAADAPPRLKRADSFLGIHFDFHAGEDCDRVGIRTTPAMVELIMVRHETSTSLTPRGFSGLPLVSARSAVRHWPETKKPARWRACLEILAAPTPLRAPSRSGRAGGS